METQTVTAASGELGSYLADLDAASSAGDCMEVTKSHVSRLGFRNVLFAYTRRPVDTDGDLPPYIRHSSIPQFWEERYRLQGYQNHCPLYRESLLGGNLPIIWHKAWEGVEKDPTQEQMVDEAAGAGLANGISISIEQPNGDRSAVAIATDLPLSEAEPLIEAHLPLIFLMSHYLYATVVDKYIDFGSHPKDKLLTATELDCLHWVAAGKGTWEISEIRGISQNTVKFHLRNILTKLGVSNRAAAIAKAYRLGLLEF